MNDHSPTVLELEKVRRMLLRWTFSSLGAGKIRELAPTLDRARALRSLDEISEWKRLELAGAAPNPDPLADLSPLLLRLDRGAVSLSGSEIALFVPLLRQLVELKRVLGPRTGSTLTLPLLSELLAQLEDFSDLARRLERSISPGGELLDEASPTLARARRDLFEAQRSAADLLDGLLSRVSAAHREETFVTLRDGRYVVSVRSNMREAFPGLLHGRSQTGQSVLIEPLEALDANNRVAERREEERAVQAQVLIELTERLRERIDALEVAYEATGEIDRIRACGKLALLLRSEAPELNDHGRLRIVQGRHPILAEAETRGGTKVVPLDIELLADRPVMLVSGPNMGGKTVALKTVGLLVLMARSGLQIPAAPGTTVPFVDHVFVDLGDEQSIEADLSTFAGHLKNIGAVWEGATQHSLVLLDELGGATDPEEGAAFSMALLDEMARRGALTLATTHLTSLKLFVQEQPKMQNAAMEFDSVSLVPRYRLEIGEPGRSRAFEIARRMLPGSGLLTRAEEYRSPQLVELDRLYERVADEQRRVAKEREELEGARQRLEAAAARRESQAEKLRERLDALRRARAEVMENALREAEEAVAGVKKQLEEELRKGRGEQALQTVRRSERDLQGLRARSRSADRRGRTAAKRLGPDQVAIGSRAWIADLGAIVRIERVSPDASKARVEWQGRHLEVPIAALEEVPGDAPLRAQGRVRMPAPPTEAVATELDLRGARAEEAVVALERYLDQASLGGLGRVRIVHGKGTGALKREVEQLVARHPQVAAYRGGEREEGGWGVTIVDLSPANN